MRQSTSAGTASGRKFRISLRSPMARYTPARCSAENESLDMAWDLRLEHKLESRSNPNDQLRHDARRERRAAAGCWLLESGAQAEIPPGKKTGAKRHQR